MVYCDMDGFLVKYDYSMYEKKPNGQNWCDLGSHVFRRLEVDPIACAIVKRLIEQLGDEVYVLTNVYGGSIPVRNEQIFDKMKFLQEHLPWFNLCNFIACESEKRNSITKIKGMNLTEHDILIDDYKKNLSAWRSSGGTAIKYINGINSIGDWPGPVISYSSDIDVSVKTVLNQWYINS